MNNIPLKLSEKSIQDWLILHPRTVPARICDVYGIDYELLNQILDSWMDNTENKGMVNLAAEICVQNYVKARRNDKDINILVVGKAIEKLRDNLFSMSPGVSLRANRVLGNVLDEYSQRKIQINIQLNKSVIEAIRKVAELDGEQIIDVISEDGRDEKQGQDGLVLLGYQDSGIQQNDSLASEDS